MADEKKDEQAQPSPAAPAAPAAPTGPAGEPWSGELVDALRKAFPGVSIEAFTFRGQNYLILPKEHILAVAKHFKSECNFNMLADLTAVDYPKREKRFEVIYQLYSFPRNERLRLKVPLGDGETIESMVSVWGTADGFERTGFAIFRGCFEQQTH